MMVTEIGADVLNCDLYLTRITTHFHIGEFFRWASFSFYVTKRDQISFRVKMKKYHMTVTLPC